MKNQKGITLVALVVTIVVLLILAGITIMYVMSDNGIFGKAQEAGTKTDDAVVKEAVTLAIGDLYAEIYIPVETGKTLPEVLKAAFEADLPKDITVKTVTGKTPSVTATANDASTLVIADYVLTYKSVDYTVAYDKTNGVQVSRDTTPTT